jgi:hypothetical protein
MKIAGSNRISPCTGNEFIKSCTATLLRNAALKDCTLSFSHPDYTVGSGITPDQPSATGRRVTDFASMLDRYPYILHHRR